MKLFLTEKRCDPCWQDGEQTVGAVNTWTVGLATGQVRPMLKVVDTCEVHDKIFADLQGILATANLLDPAVKAYPAGDTACPVCDFVTSATGGARRSTLVTHIWAKHANAARPKPPKMCPDCRQQFDLATACGSHRVALHGYDSITDALAHVPGFGATR